MKLGQLGLDNSFTQDLGFADVGITPSMYRHTIGVYKGMFNLMSKNTFEKQKSKPYIKAILERITAERKGTDMPKGTIMDIFPQPKEECLPGIKGRDVFCNTGIIDMTEMGLIEEKPITHETLTEVFDKYCVIEGCSKIW
jgi:hypothetical protein